MQVSAYSCCFSSLTVLINQKLLRLVCYFDDSDSETVHKAADEVIKALNQNSVLIEQDEIKIEFYSGK